MTKEDKENLQNKRLSDSLIVSYLATCESVISKNAYLEKNTQRKKMKSMGKRFL